MHCGQMLGQPAVAGGPRGLTQVAPAIPVTGQGRGRGLWTGIGLAALILAASVWGLTNSGSLRLGGAPKSSAALQSSGGDPLSKMLGVNGANEAQQMLGAMGDDPSAVLQAQGESGSNMLAAPGDAPPNVLPSQAERARMPQDVYEWLLHLERVELKKERLMSGQESRSRRMPDTFPKRGRTTEEDEESGMGDIMSGMSVDGDFLAGIQARIRDLSSEWKVLVREFGAYPPPAECRPMAQQYDQALREIGAQIEDVASLLDSAMSDPFGAIGKLETFKGGSESAIDDPLDQVDASVASICRKYDTPKWFKVKSHRGGASMLGGGLGF